MSTSTLGEVRAGLPELATRTDTQPAVTTSPVPRQQPGARSRRRGGVAILLALILVGFAARCFWIAGVDAITCDEATHLVHCLHFWMTGDDLSMWELGAPRLPHVLAALPSYLSLKLAGLLPAHPGGEDLRSALTELVHQGSDQLLSPARMVAIGWGLLLLILVYWSLARMGHPYLGLVAAAITGLTPEVIAHASIAGSDMPFTAAAFAALIMMVRYAERPGPGRWCALALVVGLAWAMRHTGLLLLGMAGVVHLLVRFRQERPRHVAAIAECLLGSLWAGVGLTAVAFLVLWAGDGFGLVTVGEVAERVTMLRIPTSLGATDLAWLPLPSSLLSVLKQVRHQGAGHEAFFLGEVRTTGWLLYFPIAFLLKTPIGLLVLLVLVAARVRPRGPWDAVALGFLALLWFMLVRGKVDIGLRYALLTYPLLATFIARMFAPALLRDRLWGPATILATAALAWASVSSGTRCLSYFNEIGGGSRQGWVYLSDSNVDWGQDFDALAQTVRARGITEITTDVQPVRRLDLPGVREVINPGRALQVPATTPLNRRLYDSEGGYIPIHTRYVAVSATRMRGLYSKNDMSWLWTRKLVTRVGDSLFLFDMDHPASAPLYE